MLFDFILLFQDTTDISQVWKDVSPYNALGYSALVAVLMWFGYNQFKENKKILRDNIEMLTKVNLYLDSDDIPKRFEDLKVWIKERLEDLSNKLNK